MNRATVVFLIILLMLISIPDLFGQCSQCKLLAEQSGQAMDDEILGTSGKNNINSAILYIMAVPYIILVVMFRNQILRLFHKKG